MDKAKKVFEYIALVILAVLLAVNYTVFIFPNRFAPTGIDGICTMIQDATNVSMGYMSLLVNIPLLILAFIYLNRDFAIKNALFVICFSFAVVLLKKIDISAFCYHTDTGSSIALAPVAAGAIRGIIYELSLQLNASSGGIDIIAAMIKNKKPYCNFMNILFFINLGIAVCSYFVYGLNPEPVICSIIYAFITSTVSTHLRIGKDETVKFEIITQSSDRLCKDISNEIHETATIMEATGAYTGADRKMVVCVVKKEKVPYLENLLLAYKDTMVFKSFVNCTLSGTDYK